MWTTKRIVPGHGGATWEMTHRDGYIAGNCSCAVLYDVAAAYVRGSGLREYLGSGIMRLLFSAPYLRLSQTSYGALSQKSPEKSISERSIGSVAFQSSATASCESCAMVVLQFGAISRNVFAAVKNTLSSPVSFLSCALLLSAASAQRSSSTTTSTVSLARVVSQTGSCSVRSLCKTLRQ
jgi:hypothetical protein